MQLLLKIFLLAIISIFCLAEDLVNFRVFHADEFSGSIDIYSDGSPFFKGLTFNQITPWSSVSPNKYHVQLFPPGIAPANKYDYSSKAYVDVTYNFPKNKRYSLIFIGGDKKNQPYNAFGSVFIQESNQLPASGKVHIRVVHGFKGAPPVDVYLVPKGVSNIYNIFPFAYGVPYGVSFPDASLDSLSVDSGMYTVVVAAAGTKSVLFNSGVVSLVDGSEYLVVAIKDAGYPTTSSYPVELLVVSKGSSSILRDAANHVSLRK